MIVSGAEEVPVRTRSEVFKLLKRGAERKTMAATMMNLRSRFGLVSENLGQVLFSLAFSFVCELWVFLAESG